MNVWWTKTCASILQHTKNGYLGRVVRNEPVLPPKDAVWQGKYALERCLQMPKYVMPFLALGACNLWWELCCGTQPLGPAIVEGFAGFPCKDTTCGEHHCQVWLVHTWLASTIVYCFFLAGFVFYRHTRGSRQRHGVTLGSARVNGLADGYGSCTLCTLTTTFMGVAWCTRYESGAGTCCCAKKMLGGRFYDKARRVIVIVITTMLRLTTASAAPPDSTKPNKPPSPSIKLKGTNNVIPLHPHLQDDQHPIKTHRGAYRADPVLPAFTRRREHLVGRVASLGMACCVAGEIITAGAGPVVQLATELGLTYGDTLKLFGVFIASGLLGVLPGWC